MVQSQPCVPCVWVHDPPGLQETLQKKKKEKEKEYNDVCTNISTPIFKKQNYWTLLSDRPQYNNIVQ